MWVMIMIKKKDEKQHWKCVKIVIMAHNWQKIKSIFYEKLNMFLAQNRDWAIFFQYCKKKKRYNEFDKFGAIS